MTGPRSRSSASGATTSAGGSTSTARARSSTPRSRPGITFFDTADIYGSPHGRSEEFLGEVLQGRRDQVVLATKFGMNMDDGRGPRGSRDYILQAVEASLRRLRTDVIDYYWYHQPDGVTPIAETLETLTGSCGPARCAGSAPRTSAPQQIEEADAVARERGFARFTSIQNQYSLLVRDPEREVLPTCERLGLGFVPFFPLASGLLTGKYRRGEAAPAGTRLAEPRAGRAPTSSSTSSKRWRGSPPTVGCR